jgi:hypothetical protein
MSCYLPDFPITFSEMQSVSLTAVKIGRHELGAGAFVGDPVVFVDGLLLARTWWTYTAGDSAIVITFSAPAGCVFSVVGVWRAN